MYSATNSSRACDCRILIFFRRSAGQSRILPIAPPPDRRHEIGAGQPDGGDVRRRLANRPRALAMVTDLFSLPQRHDHLVSTDTEYWEMRAYRRSDIARGKMRVVLFGHARVGMTELGGDDTQTNTLHRQMACMSVTQHMKIHRRCYFCNLACLNKRSLLVRLPPRMPILTNKNVRVRGTPCRPAYE